MVGGFAVGTAAGASTNESDGARAIYVSGGTIHTVDTDGDVHDLGVNAEVVGRLRDLDNDGTLEMPLVDGQGNLKLADTSGSVTTLATGAMQNTVIATGDLDGDGTQAVFYTNKSANYYVYKVELGGQPTRTHAIKTKGVLGIVDFNNDGDTDLVYEGDSKGIYYYDNGSSSSKLGALQSYDGGGIARDLNGDGIPRVPYVDGSGYLELVNYKGNVTTLTQSYTAKKTHVGAVNWTGDATMEVLSLDAVNSPAEVHYTFLNGTTRAVTNASGSKLSGDTAVGVAASPGLLAPEITNYTVSNPTGRTLEVAFNASDELTTINVSVTGDASTTLTRSEFNESGTGPYHYEATWEVPTDGNYTATLRTAADAQGNDGAENQSGNVTIQTASPDIENATLSDLNDSDGIVNDGHRVRVSAEVPDTDPQNVTVTANASAFGAGSNITMTHVGNRTYVANFTVDGATAAPDGDHVVNVTAVNQYGHTTTMPAGPLTLDTTAPNADAGLNATVSVDTELIFDAGGSTDASPIVSYHWSFGDGATATGAEVTHAYAETGTYTATLTVTDAAGNVGTDTRTVEVINSTTNITETKTVTKTVTETVTETNTIVRTVDDDDENTTQMRNLTVEDGTATYRVRHVDADESIRFVIPDNASTAGARLRTVTVVTDHNGTVRTWVTPNATAPAGAASLDQTGHVDPVGYWNLTATNAESATLQFQVPDSRLGQTDPDAVSLYRYVDGTWERIDAQHVTASNGTHQFVARVPDLSRTAIYGVGIRRGDLNVSTVVVGDNSTVPGREVVVHATVTNDGARAVTDTLVLTVNGTAVANRTVTVPAEGARNLTFAFAPDTTGSYRLAVGDTTGETVSVHNASDTTEDTEDDTTPAGSTALGLLGALALAGVSYGIGRSDANPAELLE